MKPYQTIFTPVRLLLLSVLIILLWVMLTPSTFAAAGIRRTINFQGKLVNKSDGTNITDGSYTFVFKFYDAASAGTQLPSGAAWTETQTITVTNGIFRAELGSVTSIPTTLDFNSDSIYLDITFNSENFGSRVRMTAVPYAFNAEKVSGLTVTNTTGTLTIPNSKTISFADAFTTSGAFPLTLTSSATTNATLPPGTITLVDLAATQTLTNKSIGSTGLTFTGAAADITTSSSNNLTIAPGSTGKVVFTVGNATSSSVGITASSLTTGSALNVTATSTPTTASSTSNGVTLALTQAAATNATTYTGLNLQYTQNPTVAGNTSYAAQIQNQVTANTTDNTVAALLLLDNADTSATGSTVVTDALRITNSGAIAAGVTNGIAFRSTTIGTGINFVSTPTTNYISGTNFSVTAAGAPTFAGAITAPTSSNTINGLIINSSTQTLGANTITDSGALTITSTGANTLALDSGTTGNVTLGANANAKTITVGNVTGATTLNLKAGTGSILLAGAATGTSATFLGLPVKTDAGDPTTTQINGAMYYNSSSGFFRCFQASAWTNCIGSSSGATGSGVANQVTYWSGTTTLAGNAGLTFNPGSTSGTTLALSNASLTTGSAFNVTATSTPTTLSSTSNGVTLALTQAAATNATTYTGLNLQYTQNPTVAGNTSYAAQIQNQVTANITDNTVAALLLLDNADTSATGSTVVTDALRITNSGAIAAGVTNGIAFRSTTIGTGINFVSTPTTNYISGTNFSVTATGNETIGGTLTVNGTGASTIQGPTTFGASGNYGIVTLLMQSADTFSSGLRVEKRGTTSDATAAVSSGSELGYHEFYGWDGSAYGRGAYVIAKSTEAYTSTAHGTSYSIFTTPNTTTTNTQRLLIDQDGTIYIGTSGTTGTQLVLNTKTNSGDPSGFNGGIYYNSNLGKFRCYENSSWINCTSGGLSGTGVANQVTYWSGTNTVAGNAGLTFNPGSTSGNTLALLNTSLTTGSAFNVTATSTPTTASSTSNGVTLALTQAAATNATTYTGLNLQYTQNPTVAGNTSYAAQIQNQVTANITDNTVAALLRLDNADTSATGSTVVTDGLRIDNSGAISGGIVNGIAFRATTITNGLNFVSTPATNYITGTNFTVASGGNITTAGNLTFTNAATVSLTASSTTALNIQSGLLDFDTTNSRVGIGTTAPSAALHVLKTTEQLRLGYDATNFQSFTVNSTAGLTIKTAVDSTGALLYTNSANGSLLNVDSTNSIIDLLANNTGELKAWQTNTNNLNTAMGDFGTATYHGYVYAVGGYSQALAGAQTTVQYAKLNADGSTGAWATLNSLPAARSGCGTFAVNGYLYCVNGYNSGAFSSVYYAKINQDGTLGTWQTQSSNLPQNASFDSGYFEANGYIYLVGGAGAGVASQQWVQYARVLANGGTGAWTLLSTALVTAETAPATVYANGYVYAIGGYGTNSSGSATTNVQYAKVNTDGSLGSFTDQVSNKLGLARGYGLGATANGYVYVMGGNNAGDTNTVQYSKITISDHSLGAWTTSTRNLPGAKEQVGSTPVVNGYVYFYGGANGAADTNTVYYASVAKLKIGGALDLVGDSNAVDLADGRSSGQLTSGSHDVIGDLSVRGDAVVRGGLDIQGLSFFNDDVSFQKVRMTAGNAVTFDDGTATTANSDLPLGRLKEYFSGAGYGVFESTGFINLQGSFLMENFIQERASITGENTNLTNHFGDQFEWNLRTLGTGVGTNTTGTSPCNVGQNTDVVPTNNLNGVLEAQPANSTSTNGQGGNCYLYMGVSTLSGTNTPGNAMLRVANKFIMYYKFKPSAQVTNTPSQKYMFLGADNYVQGWFGMPTQTETGKGGMWLANITATGSNGSANTVWNGVVRSGTNNSTVSFSCSSGSANIQTNAYAIARLEARATNDFRFFLDSDISNGVNLSNCTAQATSNIITQQLRPAMMFANLSPQSASATWAMFVDLFAYVQDDPLPSGNGSSQALVSDQPAPAEQPSAISGADLAEQYFMPNSNAGPGDVVMMGSSPGLAVPADKPYDHNMLGVVSESPGLQIGVANSQTKPIALTGRVPVRVTTKNGEIKKGDPITSSDIPGVAMKATKAGKILGTAMEDYASHDEGKIMVNINVSYYIGQENDTAFIEKGADVLGLSDKPVASLSGKLASDSAQIASGSASLAQSFESLKDLIFKGAVEFWNKVTFKGVAEYLAEVFFRQNVHFDGQVEFNSDSAGYAKIKEGERFVEVKFDKEYKNEPIVNISISLPRVIEETFKGYIASGQCDAAAGINACQDKIASQVLSEDMKAAVAAKTTQGFVILLNKASPVDITFSWQAVAVKEAKTTVSKSTEDLVKELEKTASSSAQTGQVAGESTSSAVLQIKNTLEKEASKSSQLQGDASVDSKKGTIKQTDLGYVRLRSKSSVDGEELAQIPSGTDITYTAVENGWYQVSFEGKTGWVSGEYVK